MRQDRRCTPPIDSINSYMSETTTPRTITLPSEQTKSLQTMRQDVIKADANFMGAVRFLILNSGMAKATISDDLTTITETE